MRIGSRNDGAKTAPSKIPAAARREKALELRAKGMSIRAIAGKLGVSKSQVQRDIVKELQAAAVDRKKIAGHIIDLELAKLDALEKKAWEHITDGELSAIDRVLRSMERRAKLLGLDAAEKIEHSGVVSWMELVKSATNTNEGRDGSA
ncbi:helix-turn-helix domain-containing protein [Candidatus Darwinibacter acetoxidans]